MILHFKTTTSTPQVGKRCDTRGCARAQPYICIYTCMYTYIYMYMCIRICVYKLYIYIYICTYIHTCIHLYIYIYIFVYVYIDKDSSRAHDPVPSLRPVMHNTDCGSTGKPAAASFRRCCLHWPGLYAIYAEVQVTRRVAQTTHLPSNRPQVPPSTSTPQGTLVLMVFLIS